MCMGGPPKVNTPPPPQAPKLADAGVQQAGDEERRRVSGMVGSRATDVTRGSLAPATTQKKTATGQ